MRLLRIFAPGPSRFSIRELLILSGSKLERSDQIGYLHRAFEWYYDRTRTLLGLLSAIIVGIAIAAASGRLHDDILWIIAATLGALIALYLMFVGVLVAPLHREFLSCLILLERLEKYLPGVRAVLGTDAQPDPHLHGHVFRRTIDRDGSVVVGKLQDAQTAFRPRTDEHPQVAAGRYLFEVLGPVPTDDYERRRQVRRCVDLYLRQGMPFSLRTERLELRAYRPDDIPLIHARLYGDAEARRHTGGPSTRSETQAIIEGYISGHERDGHSFWAVCERETGELIGEAGLRPLDDVGPEIELGYALAPAFWRRGYATEAGRALLALAFGGLGLDQVGATVHTDNGASRVVLEKLGFQPAGSHSSHGVELLYLVRERD